MTPEGEMFARRMRVRRIAGGIQIATGFVAVVGLFVIVAVLGSDQAGVVSIMVLFSALGWFAAQGPADRIAARIEAWLSSPP